MSSVRTRPDDLIEALLLAAVGGFLDAYTFVGRGGVFANAQTGNIVIGAAEVASGRIGAGARHLPPLLAFLVGAALAETLGLPRIRRRVLRPTRVVLVLEIAVLIAVGWVSGPGTQIAVTTAVAFAASLQVASFNKMRATRYSSTLTTGNLRSLVTGLFDWLARGRPEARQVAQSLGGVVLAFAVGAGAGALATRHLNAKASWLPAATLVLVFALVVRNTRRLRAPAAEP